MKLGGVFHLPLID